MMVVVAVVAMVVGAAVVGPRPNCRGQGKLMCVGQMGEFKFNCVSRADRSITGSQLSHIFWPLSK
jgi:hypothetical protein